MLEILRDRWHADLPFAELIELREELETMLHRIRAERYIRPPVIRCPRCGHVGEAAEPDVTVRAMILSLGRFGSLRDVLAVASPAILEITTGEFPAPLTRVPPGLGVVPRPRR